MNKILIIIVISCLMMTGCATNSLGAYKEQATTRLNTIYDGHLLSAMNAKNSDDILFNMEYGTLLATSQQYDKSNVYFSRAQNTLDQWTTEWLNTTSGNITRTTVAMLIGDGYNDYDPKGYEKSFLPTLHALNHIGLNDFASARIEIQKMYQTEVAIQNYNQSIYDTVQQETENSNVEYHDELSSQMMSQYNFGNVNLPAVLTLTNSYQNAFSHYLAGFVFEALNEPGLSRPGYVKASELNPSSTLIRNSINHIDSEARTTVGYSDLLIVEEVGHAPIIQSNQASFLFVPKQINSNNNFCPVLINVFYPSLIFDERNSSTYNFYIDSMQREPVQMVDVNLMAQRAIKDDIPHIIERNFAAAARNMVTTQASCAAGGDLGPVLNIFTNYGGTLLDQADERNWSLLPNKINIDRITLPYGTHTIAVNVNGTLYKQSIKLNQPYQVITFRIMGNQVFFNPQKSMH